ncbi:hypothetical protein [[Limnothrix rosea] IAM M-220]|uniref:DUF7925 domain-containing protein n=1 Tax=[Limnothrix rosea] IAM M-220 TaxID=454133 RepID=UPI000A019592|nr:hypothetical protein [[Limnothrix rosea] IAM M-220]
MSSPKRSPKWSRSVSPFLVAGLLVTGNFHFIPQVLALGTAAGTPINNRATATYEDPDGNEIDAISNTVIITVAEVAGITAVPDQIVDRDGGAVEAGDTLDFSFTVTNTGNDTNQISVPTNVGTENFDVIPAGNIRVEYDENGNGTIESDEVYTFDGTAFLNPSNVDFETVDVPADDDFLVIVTGTVPATGVNSGDPVSVTLGDTPTVGDQNVDFDGSLDTNDLATLQTDPVNGRREASATQSIPFASSVNPLALARVEKNDTNYVEGDLTTYSDDLITYELDVDVADTDPSNLFQPGSLAGTNITLDGATAQRILVSDAIPTDTQLSSTSTTLPSGWSVVYTTDSPTTAGNEAPTEARWWTSFGTNIGQPATLADVARIGFIFDGSLAAGYDTANEAGSLSFTVQVTSTSTAPGLNIYNLAQLLGITQGDDPADPNDIVYDESGDDNTNNFSDDGTPTPYDPNNDTGDPGTPPDDDTDDGTNTGTDTDPAVGGGEPNRLPLTIIAANDTILIGPDGAAGAVGPDGTQDTDFTNQSAPFTPVDADNDGNFDAFTPPEIVYTNTIQNPATSGFIADATVEPADIAQSGAAAGDIPTGTIVRITNGVNTAFYEYQADGTWSAPGTTPDFTGGNPDNPGIPVIFDDQLTAQETQQVTVGVQFPELSSADDIPVNELPSYPITLIVFPEDDPTNPGFDNEVTSNLTIDRAYPAGYVELLKEARILDSTGAQVFPAATGTYAEDGFPALEIGQVIEYRITYTNISEGNGVGTSNGLLPATNFFISEDGTTAPNNWALDNDANGTVDTLHQNGATRTDGDIYYYSSATDTNFTGFDPTAPSGSTTDPADDLTVQGYINLVGDVNPQDSGSFTFQRELQ